MNNPTYLLALFDQMGKQEKAQRRLAQLEINLRQVNGAQAAIRKEEQRFIKRLKACTTQRQRDGATARFKAFCNAEYDRN
jgi:hypothetical protein